MVPSVACLCCRLVTLSRRNHFDICPVCFWADDTRGDDPARVVRGGLNGSLTLGEARRNYAAFGACEVRVREHVRPPRTEEIPADG